MRTIAAIATAAGVGGVAIIRISGEKSLEIAKKMFSPVKKFEPNYMYAGHIEGNGFKDYGYLVYFKAPKSFTGEDVVELHCHGGVKLSHGILEKCLTLGAELAERGEFTKRAFLNGKLSLASAEGMADMINAESEALLRAASMLYNEKLSKEVRALQDNLKDILARAAVEIDYPEEDESGLDLKEIAKEIIKLKDRTAELLSGYKSGKMIKEGVTVALCGKPNVGKSSLLNALLGYEKAIVSPEAGTTRDAVEGAIEICGVKYGLYDTAGIRETSHGVESCGISLAEKIINSADVILSVSEGEEIALPEKATGEVIRVFNKCDQKKPAKKFDISVSAKTGKGIEELKKLIYKRTVGDVAADKAYVVEERHYSALKRAMVALDSAAENIGKITLDFITVDLKDAWDAFGEITGETANEEIISTVFAKFCVGK